MLVRVLVPSLLSSTGCGMLQCRGCSTAAPGLELARKPEHVKVLLKRLRCSRLRTSSASKSGRKPSQAFDAKYVNVKVQQTLLAVAVKLVEKPVRKLANKTEFIYFSFICLSQAASEHPLSAGRDSRAAQSWAWGAVGWSPPPQRAQHP